MIINIKMSIVGSLDTTPLGLMAPVLALQISKKKKKLKKSVFLSLLWNCHRSFFVKV